MNIQTIAQQLNIRDPETGASVSINGPLEAGKYNTLADVINPLLRVVFPIMLIIAFLLIVWAGFNLARSFGDPEALKKAQARLTNVIIGLILLAISYWLAGVLASIFFP